MRCEPATIRCSAWRAGAGVRTSESVRYCKRTVLTAPSSAPEMPGSPCSAGVGTAFVARASSPFATAIPSPQPQPGLSSSSSRQPQQQRWRHYHSLQKLSLLLLGAASTSSQQAVSQPTANSPTSLSADFKPPGYTDVRAWLHRKHSAITTLKHIENYL
eukprot:SAG25_NODE_1273_length_3426_cov_43.929967_5_plen_159_part_00